MNREVSAADLNIEAITRRVMEDLTKGVAPWEKPWFYIPSLNGLSGKAYRGLNYVHLAIMRDDFQFSSPVWVTFKQAQQLKGNIKKGSKGFKICYYDIREKERVNRETGKVEVNLFFIFKFATVFNLDQTEGLEALRERYLHHPPIDIHQQAQHLIASSGVHVMETSTDRACFKPNIDVILVPNKDLFKSTQFYYATIFHELIHWTGAPTRLHRDFSGRFGEEAYAFEELVAELGASLLCAYVGFAYSTQHSAYIASWIRVLKNEPKALLIAGNKAQQAVDYLLNLQIEHSQQEVA